MGTVQGHHRVRAEGQPVRVRVGCEGAGMGVGDKRLIIRA